MSLRGPSFGLCRVSCHGTPDDVLIVSDFIQQFLANRKHRAASAHPSATKFHALKFSLNYLLCRTHKYSNLQAILVVILRLSSLKMLHIFYTFVSRATYGWYNKTLTNLKSISPAFEQSVPLKIPCSANSISLI